MLTAAVCAPCIHASACFASKQQQYVYEQGIASPQENNQITACLLKKLNPEDFDTFDQAAASLRKSNNTAPALGIMMRIFKETKNPQAAFTAAAFLVSAPYELGGFEKDLLGILHSNAADYKKTLAVIILAAMEAVGGEYASFLTPAIDGEDIVLQAYAAAAYTIIVPGAMGRYLDKIIFLYGFDKNLAQTAFAATGLKDKDLHAALKENLKNPNTQARISAIEWIGETGDRKLLDAAFGADNKDSAVQAAAAQAVARNFAEMRGEVKKAFRKAPSTPQATIAVMAYAFNGGAGFDDIENFLKSGNNNEISNALRVVSAVAGILAEDSSNYQNPGLEEQRIKRLIPLVSHISGTTKNAQVKTYADNAVKELYKLINTQGEK